jgi:hypothetical protein
MKKILVVDEERPLVVLAESANDYINNIWGKND